MRLLTIIFSDGILAFLCHWSALQGTTDYRWISWNIIVTSISL